MKKIRDYAKEREVQVHNVDEQMKTLEVEEPERKKAVPRRNTPKKGKGKKKQGNSPDNTISLDKILKCQNGI